MRSRTFPKQSSAVKAKTEIDHALIHGSFIDPGLGKVKTGEWAEIWHAGQAGISPTTRSRHRSILDAHVIPRWGMVSLSKITHAGVQAWVAELSESMSPGSVRKVVGVLSRLLAMAVQDGRLPRNVASGLSVPRPAPSERKYLTYAEVFKLAEECAAKRDGGPANSARQVYRLAVLLLASCGLRWSELTGLRVRDIDLERGRLDVHTTTVEVDGRQVERMPKNGARRSVPLPDFLRDELRDYLMPKAGTDFVIPGVRGGRPLRNRVFRRAAFDRAADAIGHPGLTPHMLRHTTASLAVSANANPKALQRILGHKSAALTLDTYADLFDTDLDAVAANLNQAARRALAESGADI